MYSPHQLTRPRLEVPLQFHAERVFHHALARTRPYRERQVVRSRPPGCVPRLAPPGLNQSANDLSSISILVHQMLKSIVLQTSEQGCARLLNVQSLGTPCLNIFDLNRHPKTHPFLKSQLQCP